MSIAKSVKTLCVVATLYLAVSSPVSATVLGFTDLLKSNEPGTVGIIEEQYGKNGASRINDYAHDSSVKNTDVESSR